MLKAHNAINANKAWVWGAYRKNGSAIVSASTARRSCVRCPGIIQVTSPVSGDQGHRDDVRTFGFKTIGEI